MLIIPCLSMIKAIMIYNIHAEDEVEIDEVDASYLYVYYALIYYENKNKRIEQLKSLIYNKKEPQEIFKYFANLVSADFLSLGRIKRHTIFTITGDYIELKMRTCDEQLKNYITSLDSTILSEESVNTKSYPENYLLAIARFIVELLDQSGEEKKLLVETLRRDLTVNNEDKLELSQDCHSFSSYNCDITAEVGPFNIYYEIFTRFQETGEQFKIIFNTGISCILLLPFFTKAKTYLYSQAICESNDIDFVQNSGFISYLLENFLSIIYENFEYNMLKSIDTSIIPMINNNYSCDFKLDITPLNKDVDGLISAFLDTYTPFLSIENKSLIFKLYYETCYNINTKLYFGALDFFEIMSNKVAINAEINRIKIYRK